MLRQWPFLLSAQGMLISSSFSTFFLSPTLYLSLSISVSLPPSLSRARSLSLSLSFSLSLSLCDTHTHFLSQNTHTHTHPASFLFVSFLEGSPFLSPFPLLLPLLPVSVLFCHKNELNLSPLVQTTTDRVGTCWRTNRRAVPRGGSVGAETGGTRAALADDEQARAGEEPALVCYRAIFMVPAQPCCWEEWYRQMMLIIIAAPLAKVEYIELQLQVFFFSSSFSFFSNFFLHLILLFLALSLSLLHHLPILLLEKQREATGGDVCCKTQIYRTNMLLLWDIYQIN